MKRVLITLLILLFVLPVQAFTRQRVTLDVPIVKQGKMLCGPATIEMLFRYWGVNQYDQYDIALSILEQFPNSKRYKKSGIMNTKPIDWDKYPGTGTINIREFLKRFGLTQNFMLEYEPPSEQSNKIKREQLFRKVKEHIANKIPVIVHQYWKLPKSRGHYRIVTGYDETKREVYLNDAHGGKRLVQSYEKFLDLWNFNQRWLHYNAIAFNVDGSHLRVNL